MSYGEEDLSKRVAPPRPKPTGDPVHDFTQSFLNLPNTPCFRSSLLPGIGAGAGIGFIKGLSTRNALSAGNWAIGTFLLLSLGSWHLCQSRMQAERQAVAAMVKAQQKTKLKNPEEQDSA